MHAANFAEPFDMNVYNQLSSVEEADAAVKAGSHFRDFTTEASSLFRAHNMQSRFGLALLHNHNQVEPGERMVEFAQHLDGRDALVTKPVAPSQPRSAAPTVWSIQADAFVPLEFSTDPLACSLLSDGEIPEPFLNQFKDLVRRSPIGPYLGLAVVSRAFYASAAEGEMPVEFTNGSERSNVVLLCKSSEVAGKTIETAWSLDNPRAEMSCISTCKRQCYSEPGGHKKDHIPHHPQSPD